MDNNKKVILNTQKEVDEFSLHHPDKLDSLLIVNNPEIDNLRGLSSLKEVVTFAMYQNPYIQTLEGLENLESVKGEMIIYDNPRLLDIGALSSLQSVNKLTIRNNAPSLSNIESFEELRQEFLKIDGMNKLHPAITMENQNSNNGENQKESHQEIPKKITKEIMDDVSIRENPLEKLDEDQIPEEINKIKLTDQQREALKLGNAIFLKNMELPTGQKMNGYVAFEKDKEGKPELKFLYGNSKLVIDTKIGNHTLSSDEKKDLERGRTVGPLSINNNFRGFLQVDRNINQVVVKSHSEIGIPDRIGGYQLSAEDQNRLANKEQMLPRVYKGKHGYFMATVSLTAENNGLVYSDIHGLSNKKAKEIMDTINGKQYTRVNVSDLAEITSKAVDQSRSSSIKKEIGASIHRPSQLADKTLKNENPINGNKEENSTSMKEIQETPEKFGLSKMVRNIDESSKDLDSPVNKEARNPVFPEKIGGYTLTEQDKKMILTGKESLPRIFESKGEFYLSKMIMRDGKLALYPKNIISPEEAFSTMEEVNSKKYDPEVLESPGNISKDSHVNRDVKIQM